MENLKVTLNKIKKINKHIILCGDFNHDLLKYEHNEYINEFIDTISSHFLQPCITTKPTRIVKYNRPSLVYNIFVNIYDEKIHSGNIIDKITGHLPNLVIIRSMRNKLQKRKFKIRNMKNFDKTKYLSDIKEVDNLNLYQDKDVNKMYDVYQNKLIEITEKNVPYITLSKK